MRLNIVDPIKGKVYAGELTEQDGRFILTAMPGLAPNEDNPYISPPWIDFHCHIYHGVTSFGLRPDDIGFKKGVHLLVDAGSAGEETLRGFTEYVLPHYRTKVRAFLNISSIGLVTMQECFDMRKLNPYKTAECIQANRDFLLGVKVRSSDVIVEGRGTAPLKLAIQAAEMAHCPIMIHMGENPPTNEENLSLLRGGDVLSHCFHGKDVPLWTSEGQPIPEMAAALERGVIMDVAHGAASCYKDVAIRAIAKGYKDCIISTDLHGRNVNGPVYGLSQTMTKFLAFGLKLHEVIRSVTSKPASVLGMTDWCSDLTRNCTIFRLRDRRPSDVPFIDSVKKPIEVKKVIEPISIIMDGEYIKL
jgi:dihydroorotase